MLEIERVVKRYECYRIINSLLNNFERIKYTFSGLQDIENPFIAITAYAVGLANFPPTFYLVKGSDDGSPTAPVEFSGRTKISLSAKNAGMNLVEDYETCQVTVNFIKIGRAHV